MVEFADVIINSGGTTLRWYTHIKTQEGICEYQNVHVDIGVLQSNSVVKTNTIVISWKSEIIQTFSFYLKSVYIELEFHLEYQV